MGCEFWDKPRDSGRVLKILGDLGALWFLQPDLRLGQLVTNLAGTRDLFNLSDEEMERAIWDAMEQANRRDDEQRWEEKKAKKRR